MAAQDRMEPLERLLNLVGLLLETRQPLTFEDIRETLEPYGQENVDTAKRMFERDKDLLRDYGVPLELVDVDAWGSEQGYLIPKDKYYLPEIAFTAEEMGALLVAAQSGGENSAAEAAVRKLVYGADGGALAGLSGGPLASGSDARSALILAVADAVDGNRRVRFGYRTSHGQASEREVDAFAMVYRGGHWYLVGHDTRPGRHPRVPSVALHRRDAGRGGGEDDPAGLPSGRPRRGGALGGRDRGSCLGWRSPPGPPGPRRARWPAPCRGPHVRMGGRSSRSPWRMRTCSRRCCCSSDPTRRCSSRRRSARPSSDAWRRRSLPERRRTAPKTSERLGRMLVIVPYLVQHQGAELGEVARLFDVPADQLRRDLDLLFMSGLPPYGPGDLIDVEVDEDDQIWIRMADHFARPLRLTRSEALALFLRGTELVATPGLPEAPALASALAKLRDSLGPDALGDAARIQTAAAGRSPEHLGALRAAARGHERITIEYVAASTGARTERRIEPEEVFSSARQLVRRGLGRRGRRGTVVPRGPGHGRRPDGRRRSTLGGWRAPAGPSTHPPETTSPFACVCVRPRVGSLSTTPPRTPSSSRTVCWR